MKKLTIVLSLLCSTMSYVAPAQQEPDRKTRSLILNFTENLSAHCSTWGLDNTRQILGHLGDKGYLMSLMIMSVPGSLNFNATCYRKIAKNYYLNGYPTLIFNDSSQTGFFYAVDGWLKKVDDLYPQPPVASPVGSFYIEGDKLILNTKTKFWSDTNGEYYLAGFVVEDSVVGPLILHPDEVFHSCVLRTVMMPDTFPWGQLLVNGAVKADTEISRSFQAQLNLEQWDTSKLSVILAVYKKDGFYNEFFHYRHELGFINSRKAIKVNKDSNPENNDEDPDEDGADSSDNNTSVHEYSLLPYASVYPNPLTVGNATVAFSLLQAKELYISVTDIFGRVVYAAPDKRYNAGFSQIQLPAAYWRNGIYNVRIIGERINKNMLLVRQDR